MYICHKYIRNLCIKYVRMPKTPDLSTPCTFLCTIWISLPTSRLWPQAHRESWWESQFLLSVYNIFFNHFVCIFFYLSLFVLFFTPIYFRYIRYVRETTVEDLTYIKANVWAEMCKSVFYAVDFSVNLEGVIMECQCECAVGQGPSAHCKHICTVLHGLTVFKNEGDILTEATCTQVWTWFYC